MFNDLIGLSKWNYCSNYLVNEVTEIMYDCTIDDIPQEDIDNFINCMTIKAQKSKMNYCFRNDEENDEYDDYDVEGTFVTYLIDTFPITHKQFKQILKCEISHGPHEWINTWHDKHPDIKFDAIDKKHFARIGYIDAFNSDELTQSMFENFFVFEKYIRTNFGIVTKHNEAEAELNTKKKGLNKKSAKKKIPHVEEPKLNSTDSFEQFYVKVKEHTGNNNKKLIEEHGNTIEDATKYIESLPLRTINKHLSNSKIKITYKCITSSNVSKNPYMLLRILSISDIKMPFCDIQEYFNELIWKNETLVNSLLSFTDEYTTDDVLNYAFCNDVANLSERSLINLCKHTQQLLNYKQLKLTDNNLLIIACCISGYNSELLYYYLMKVNNKKLNDYIFDMSVKLNLTKLYFICIKNGFIPNETQIKHSISNCNEKIFESMIDNKLPVNRLLIKYMVKDSHANNSFYNCLIENIFDCTEEDKIFLSRMGIRDFTNFDIEDLLNTVSNGYDLKYIKELISDELALIALFMIDSNNFINIKFPIEDIMLIESYKVRMFFFNEIYLKQSNKTIDCAPAPLDTIKEVDVKKDIKKVKKVKKN